MKTCQFMIVFRRGHHPQTLAGSAAGSVKLVFPDGCEREIKLEDISTLSVEQDRREERCNALESYDAG